MQSFLSSDAHLSQIQAEIIGASKRVIPHKIVPPPSPHTSTYTHDKDVPATSQTREHDVANDTCTCMHQYFYKVIIRP